MFVNIILAAILGASYVQAHGTMTTITGANGVTGQGFGIVADTPRDGSTRKPFQQDTSIIRDKEIASGKTGPCGRTDAGGNNDVAAQMAAAASAGLPSTDASGTLTMNIHQVNQDGAGPYICDVSTDGGATFKPATIGTNVPGRDIPIVGSLSGAKATDFPLTATVPAGTQCAAGPDGNACIMRCRNSAIAGPFGSCAAFTMDGADAAAAGDAAAPAAAAPAKAAAAKAPAAAAPAAAAPAAAAGKKAGGLAGLLGGLGGGAAGGAGGAGGLAGLLGGAKKQQKRVVLSRVAGAKAGLWI